MSGRWEDSLIALPFSLGVRTNAHTRSVHAHPFAPLPASKLRVHTSRAVSTILKGSCRGVEHFLQGGTANNLLAPTLSSSLSAFVLRLFFRLLSVPPTCFLSFPRLAVETNAVSTYTQWRRAASACRARDAEQEEKIRVVGRMGRRRRQLEATETSCIPGH